MGTKGTRHRGSWLEGLTKQQEFKASGLLTHFATKDVENLVLRHFGGIRSKNIIIPNLSWAMFNYEMDVAIITPSLQLYEVEIKRSWSDFLADFKKDFYHNDPRVSRFWYCVPFCMWEKTAEYLDEHLLTTTGIIAFDEDGEVMEMRTTVRRKEVAKMDPADVFKACRISNMRYWSNRDRKIKDINGELENIIQRQRDFIITIMADYEGVTGDKYDITPPSPHL